MNKVWLYGELWELPAERKPEQENSKRVQYYYNKPKKNPQQAVSQKNLLLLFMLFSAEYADWNTVLNSYWLYIDLVLAAARLICVVQENQHYKMFFHKKLAIAN